MINELSQQDFKVYKKKFLKELIKIYEFVLILFVINSSDHLFS